MKSTKQPSPRIVIQVERVQQRFERWRRTRKKRCRIPKQLWNAAVVVAESYGINRTARALGLDYYELKKRLDAGPRATVTTKEPIGSFVEVVSASPVLHPGCVVELESGRGTKMRIHLKGVAAPDVAWLRSLFWEGE